MFKLGVITDEVSQDLEVVIDFCKKHGLSFLELRSVYDTPVHKLSLEKVNEIKAMADEAGLEIMSISSPTYKCDIDDEAALEENVGIFKKSAEYANVLGASFIRAFDFWDSGASVEARAEKFAPIIEICKEHNVTAVLEYDPSVHSSTPAKVAETLKAINSPYVKALYDPGNGIYSEPDVKPYPDGYNFLSGEIVHIHIKDAIIDENGKPDCVKVGEGLVDYVGLFKELKAINYTGGIALETHYRLSSTLTEEQLHRPGGAAFSDGALPASEESIIALKNIINSIKE